MAVVVESNLQFFVYHADNHLRLYLNGGRVSEWKGPSGGGPINQTYSLEGLLRKGSNWILLVGADWGVTVHFSGHFIVDGKKVHEFDFSDQMNDSKLGIVWESYYEFDYKP